MEGIENVNLMDVFSVGMRNYISIKMMKPTCVIMSNDTYDELMKIKDKNNHYILPRYKIEEYCNINGLRVFRSDDCKLHEFVFKI